MAEQRNYTQYPNNNQADIYTRGSVRNNGYENAAAGTGLCSADGSMQGGWQSSAVTNQGADMEALSHGMDVAKNSGVRDLHISTTSQNVVDGLNTYQRKWESNGYLNARNKPVQHADLYWAIKDNSRYFSSVSVEKASTNDPNNRMAYKPVHDADLYWAINDNSRYLNSVSVEKASTDDPNSRMAYGHARGAGKYNKN